jgi:hypothetical protein
VFALNCGNEVARSHVERNFDAVSNQPILLGLINRRKRIYPDFPSRRSYFSG